MNYPAYIQELIDAHNARPDRIRFTDDRPEVEAVSGLMQDGVQIQPAGLRIKAYPLPHNAIRISSLIGIGDAYWTRGIVRGHLNAGIRVYLDTMFPWAFWDFIGHPNFSFWKGELAYTRKATYLVGNKIKTVYGEMCKQCHCKVEDFRLPLAPDWVAAADDLIAELKPDKPLMIFRPLVRNRMRRSVSTRNPDPAAYVEIFNAIRDRFTVISVAGRKGGADGDEVIETTVDADHTFHAGEIPLTTLLGVMARGVTYTCAGMGLVSAAAIGAPVIGIMGGYEPASNYADTVVYGPSLLIDPINPCKCMADHHDCDKRIDVPQTIARVTEFLDGL